MMICNKWNGRTDGQTIVVRLLLAPSDGLSQMHRYEHDRPLFLLRPLPIPPAVLFGFYCWSACSAAYVLD